MNERIFHTSLRWWRGVAISILLASMVVIFMASRGVADYTNYFETRLLYMAQAGSLLLLASGFILAFMTLPQVKKRSLRIGLMLATPLVLGLTLIGLRIAGAGVMAWSVVDELTTPDKGYAWLYIDGQQVLGEQQGRGYRTIFRTPFRQESEALLTPKDQSRKASFLAIRGNTLIAVHNHSLVFAFDIREHQALPAEQVDPWVLIEADQKPSAASLERWQKSRPDQGS